MINNFIEMQSTANQDVYCFLISVYANSNQFLLSINTEQGWQNGYGNSDDIDPCELTMHGLRYSNIGYEMEADCRPYEESLSSISGELYQLSITTDDQALKNAVEALMYGMPARLQDIAVDVILSLDFSGLNKTADFCAFVLNLELDWEEQMALLRRTITQDVEKMFPYIERRSERSIDPEIIALPPVEQAEKLVEYIIQHHTDLDQYTAGSRFDILLDAESRLIKLRPYSDAVIAATFDRLGPKVKAYEYGTPEFELHGPYNREFHILNALLDMAGASDAPMTDELEEALSRYLNDIAANNNSSDAECLSTSVSYALYLWGKGKYPCPV
ncbi:MAG: hypothetical protein OEZ39_18270 [Gammaproteobacteria bacterium]|nr:hypothetical protein [Gammaproteobacteria bacterium]